MRFITPIGRIARLVVGLAATVGFASGCDDAQSLVRPRDPSSVAAFVTGEAAANLDANGRLILSGPLDLPYPQITAERARELAEAFRVIHLPMIVHVMEKDRGAGINVSSLRVCGRTYYAEPSIEPLPPSVHPGLRRAYGPRWIVTLCGASGLPEVSVAVAAYSTDLGLENGRLIYPFEGGGFFSAIGIPVGNLEGLPGFPETAVASVAARTGARVGKMPRLVTLPRKLPQLSYWRLELERPVSMRSLKSGKVRADSSIFFIDDPRWGHRGSWLAEKDGPVVYEYGWVMPPSRYGEAATSGKSTVAARPGMPIKLEPVDEINR